MKLLGIDFETQSAEAKTTNITEVGASLYEEHEAGWKKVGSYSQLVYYPDYPPQEKFIVDLTGITDEMLKHEGQAPVGVLASLINLMDQADVIFAHNKAFDQTVFECTAKRFGMAIPKKEWICTLTEVPWPAKYTCKKLSHLAYDHGIIVHPDDLHRAEQDVDLMMQLILTKYNVEEILKYAREPWVYMRADVVKPWEDNGASKAIAQANGFSWEKVRHVDQHTFKGKWVTRVKESNVEKLVDSVHKLSPDLKLFVIEGLS
jgi:hypothetical protein